ncbi:MAG: GDP-mannose 4,6-dehydratase [bacterium]|nr:GDP-mannose 4,6-dehydratase [bacterium]
MNILITGITGFVGSHLAEYCLKMPDAKVYGTVFSHHLGDEMERIKHIQDKVTLIECNLTNRVAAAKAIFKARPDVIFHLAAQSFVPTSWKSPEDTLFNNIFSELNIFESVRELEMNPVIVIACSSEEYGLIAENELPIKESNPLRPLSPYAVSKITQEMLAFQYHQSYGLKTVLTRFFNIEGPGRGQDFVASNFAKQIAEIEKGKKEPTVFVGNLEAKRDFTDVRDTVRAYWLASERCAYGTPYNICSGKAWTMQEVLNILMKLSTAKNIEVRQDAERMRPSDVPVLLGDNTKFRETTGWNSEIPFEKTMEDLLNYWRERV